MAHSDNHNKNANAKSHSHTRRDERQEQQQDHDHQDSGEVLRSEIISNDREFIGGDGDRVIFEKKYFDILPNDLDSEDVDDEDVFETAPISLSASSLEEAEDLVDNRRRVNSRRFRRDLTSLSRQKRNFYHPYQPISYHQPISRHYVSDFYFPEELPYDNIPFHNILNRRSPPYRPPQPLYYYPPRNDVNDHQFASNPFHPMNNNRLKPGPTYLPPKGGSIKWV